MVAGCFGEVVRVFGRRLWGGQVIYVRGTERKNAMTCDEELILY